MIRIEGVSFSYPETEHKIFDNYSLAVNDCEHLIVDGASGIGKTTLLRLICGLEKPDTGTVEAKGRISVSFQENRLIPSLSALENVALFSDRARAEKELAALGLSEDLDKRPDELSGGMKRRVSLARALSRDFDILLLDEPFTGLDPAARNIAAHRAAEACAGKILVAVTHDPDEFAFDPAARFVSI